MIPKRLPGETDQQYQERANLVAEMWRIRQMMDALQATGKPVLPVPPKPVTNFSTYEPLHPDEGETDGEDGDKPDAEKKGD